ncbi:MAG: hypothetical protein LBU66_07870 [Treponema sp.]|nr:hypothetical protein [Treponema sp.]
MKSNQRNLRLIFITFFLFIFFSFHLFALSPAEELETLLGTNTVTYAQAARFVLDASNTYITDNQDEAFRFAMEKNWLPKNAQANQAARLDALSLLFMKTFQIKGGIFYSIFQTPRYAYREMAYRNFISGRIEPGMNITGERLLFYTGRVLTYIDKQTQDN